MTRQGVARDPLLLPASGLDSLFAALGRRGYTIVGPKVDKCDHLRRVALGRRSAARLDRGASARQLSAGARRSGSLFRFYRRASFVEAISVSAARDGGRRRSDRGGLATERPDEPVPRYAFLGVRACELAALGRAGSDVSLRANTPTRFIAAGARRLCIVAVNCTQAASTCFCTSMGTGPRCRSGFDLALTEIDSGLRVEIGTDRGDEIVADLLDRAGRVRRACSGGSGPAKGGRSDHAAARHDGIRDLLLGNLESSALGPGGRALPVVHQLHDGLSDLLLSVGPRSRRSDRRPRRATSGSGIRASISISVTRMAASFAIRSARDTGNG